MSTSTRSRPSPAPTMRAAKREGHSGQGEKFEEGRGAQDHHGISIGKGNARPQLAQFANERESWDEDFLFQHSSTSSLSIPLPQSPSRQIRSSSPVSTVSNWSDDRSDDHALQHEEEEEPTVRVEASASSSSNALHDGVRTPSLSNGSETEEDSSTSLPVTIVSASSDRSGGTRRRKWGIPFGGGTPSKGKAPMAVESSVSTSPPTTRGFFTAFSSKRSSVQATASLQPPSLPLPSPKLSIPHRHTRQPHSSYSSTETNSSDQTTPPITPQSAAAPWYPDQRLDQTLDPTHSGPSDMGRVTERGLTFASSARAFGLFGRGASSSSQMVDTQGEPTVKRRLTKKRTDDEQRSWKTGFFTSQESLSRPSTAMSNRHDSRTSLKSARAQSGRAPFELTSDEEGDAEAKERRRRTLVPAYSTSSAGSSATSPNQATGNVVQLDDGWLGVVPFPPEAPTSSPSLQPKPSSKPSLLSRRPTIPSRPPISSRNASTPNTSKSATSAERKRRSLGGIFTRSTSSVQLSAQAAAAAQGEAGDGRSFFRRPHTPSSPSKPSRDVVEGKQALHRHASSTDVQTSSGFLSRARKASKPSTARQTGPSNDPSFTTTGPVTPSKRVSSPRPAIPARTSSISRPPSTRQPSSSDHEKTFRSWKMPGNTPTPDVSTVSTIMPLRKDKPAQRRPPASRSITTSGGGSHRPSSSLSSAAPFVVGDGSESFPSRPRTALGTDSERSTSWYEESEGSPSGLERRNSLSDLRIPSRFAISQKRIEDDLERVKEFAKGIDDLKSLRRQFNLLLQSESDFPQDSPPSLCDRSFDPPSRELLHRLPPAVTRLELDFRRLWEEAETLVNLGDGKPSKPETSVRDSPARHASRRDRCVSLAAGSPARRPSGSISGSGDETETELGLDRTPVQSSRSARPKLLRRQTSVSSIETGGEGAVQERQREMLRGVLTPAAKGASFPSRGPPSPRPKLAVLDAGTPRSPSAPEVKLPPMLSRNSSKSSKVPMKPNRGIRRVSRVGVSGIKDFLLRLKSKGGDDERCLPPPPPIDEAMQKELGRRSVSAPVQRAEALPAAETPSAIKKEQKAESDEEEDWDAQSTPDVSPRTTLVVPSTPVQGGSLAMRRTKTQSNRETSKMVLTTEAMPSLVLKVRQVKSKCTECVVLLRALREG